MKGECLTKKLGVIGGLGPFATGYFFELVLKMTDARTDQEHLEMVIYNCPSIPDRTSHILGKSKNNPVIPMIDIGSKLASLNVDYIAIPCITGHFYHPLLSQKIPVPIIHMIKETALHLRNNNIEFVGLMATEGTIFSKIFQEELQLYGIRIIIPTRQGQEYVNGLIYNNVKAGRPVELDKFLYVSQELKTHGAQVIIIGCTELSIIKRDYSIGAGFLDAMEVLAAQSVLLCDAKLKKEFNCLITK
ncbi:MAG: amino acid racemase [Anaerocolumna sp.]